MDHCSAGRSRSTSVVVGYLIKYQIMRFDEAHEYVRDKQGWFEIKPGFIEQLK